MPFAIQAALLGVVQGLTEFLPVSSSAHLILARAFFGFDSDRFGLSFDVACHVGTLTLALFLGLRRPAAARFIFLLAIPAILGAAAHETPKILAAGFGGDTATLFVIGVVTSAIVGYLAVKYFIRYLANHTLDVFAWYRLALAATVAVWLWRA